MEKKEEKKKEVKNTLPERLTSDKPVVEVKLDKKAPSGVKRMTQADAKEIVRKYKKQCEPFPVRMIKFNAKKKALEEWVKSFPVK